MMTNDANTDDPILITGVSSGIGALLAQRFLEAGHAVIGHYRTPNQATETLRDSGAELLACDFTDARATMAMAAQVAESRSRLRALIHNASAFAPTDSHHESACDQLELFQAVHVRAPYLLNVHLSSLLKGRADQPGDIIHITDIYADNPVPHYDLYCASKAGLQNLALSFAKRLAPGVKVNVIQPGPITFKNWVDPAQQQTMLDATPLQRAGSPQNIFQAIRAIMGNDYQTGAIIPVDGGRHLTM